jgi:hypothetical protein
MSSEDDRYAHADRVRRGGAAAREGQPNRDRPDHDQGGNRADGRDRLQRVSQGDRADRGARWNRGDQPAMDAQALTDLGAQVYEAVATLEYSGRSVTRDEVMHAMDLDGATVSEILDALTAQGVLIRTPTGDGDTFELARRDWSATPETPSR